MARRTGLKRASTELGQTHGERPGDARFDARGALQSLESDAPLGIRFDLLVEPRIDPGHASLEELDQELDVARILAAKGIVVIAHFDWLPLAGNPVAATEELIERDNPD